MANLENKANLMGWRVTPNDNSQTNESKVMGLRITPEPECCVGKVKKMTGGDRIFIRSTAIKRRIILSPFTSTWNMNEKKEEKCDAS